MDLEIESTGVADGDVLLDPSPEGGRGGRAVAGLSPPPRPPLHLFRSPSPTHGTL